MGVLVWCAVLCLLASGAHVRAEESDVLELDADTFQDRIADKDIVLVEFYAPWCGHCKQLAPEYEKAATALTKEDPPVPLAKVDCPANSDLCSKFGVTGYPTLKIFRGGEFSEEYSGPRSADGIVSYMKKQSGPSSKEYDSVDSLKEFLAHSEHSVVGFFSDAKQKLAKGFMSAADGLRESFRFAHTFSDGVKQEFGYKDDVVIFQPPQLHTKLEESQLAYDGDPTAAKLKQFVKNKFMGLAGVRTADNMALFDAHRPLAIVYFDVDYVRNAKGSNYWRNRVIKVAKDFMGEVAFAVSSKNDMNIELEQFGVDSAQDVSVGLFDSKGQKYAMQEKFSVDNLRSFVQQFQSGALEPHIKSEPVPEDNDGPVTVVVGKNFDEVVNDESKDVLLEFYAPWCGHCKQLAPKYEELGEKLKDDPNIVIAKMDATANDYPSQYEVRGYPTIYWVPAGNKSKPNKYEGGREVNEFVAFLKKSATNTPVISGDKEKTKKKKTAKGKEEL